MGFLKHLILKVQSMSKVFIHSAKTTHLLVHVVRGVMQNMSQYLSQPYINCLNMLI